jgi:hypothetical protein
LRSEEGDLESVPPVWRIRVEEHGYVDVEGDGELEDEIDPWFLLAILE